MRVVAQIRHPRVTIVPGRCNVEIVDYHQEGAHRIAQARHPRFFFRVLIPVSRGIGSPGSSSSRRSASAISSQGLARSRRTPIFVVAASSV